MSLVNHFPGATRIYDIYRIAATEIKGGNENASVTARLDLVRSPLGGTPPVSIVMVFPAIQDLSQVFASDGTEIVPKALVPEVSMRPIPVDPSKLPERLRSAPVGMYPIFQSVSQGAIPWDSTLGIQVPSIAYTSWDNRPVAWSVPPMTTAQIAPAVDPSLSALNVAGTQIAFAAPAYIDLEAPAAVGEIQAGRIRRMYLYSSTTLYQTAYVAVLRTSDAPPSDMTLVTLHGSTGRDFLATHGTDFYDISMTANNRESAVLEAIEDQSVLSIGRYVAAVQRLRLEAFISYRPQNQAFYESVLRQAPPRNPLGIAESIVLGVLGGIQPFSAARRGVSLAQRSDVLVNSIAAWNDLRSFVDPPRASTALKYKLRQKIVDVSGIVGSRDHDSDDVVRPFLAWLICRYALMALPNTGEKYSNVCTALRSEYGALLKLAPFRVLLEIATGFPRDSWDLSHIPEYVPDISGSYELGIQEFHVLWHMFAVMYNVGDYWLTAALEASVVLSNKLATDATNIPVAYIRNGPLDYAALHASAILALERGEETADVRVTGLGRDADWDSLLPWAQRVPKECGFDPSISDQYVNAATIPIEPVTAASDLPAETALVLPSSVVPVALGTGGVPVQADLSIQGVNELPQQDLVQVVVNLGGEVQTLRDKLSLSRQETVLARAALESARAACQVPDARASRAMDVVGVSPLLIQDREETRVVLARKRKREDELSTDVRACEQASTALAQRISTLEAERDQLVTYRENHNLDIERQQRAFEEERARIIQESEARIKEIQTRDIAEFERIQEIWRNYVSGLTDQFENLQKGGRELSEEFVRARDAVDELQARREEEVSRSQDQLQALREIDRRRRSLAERLRLAASEKEALEDRIRELGKENEERSKRDLEEIRIRGEQIQTLQAQLQNASNQSASISDAAKADLDRLIREKDRKIAELQIEAKLAKTREEIAKGELDQCRKDCSLCTANLAQKDRLIAEQRIEIEERTRDQALKTDSIATLKLKIENLQNTIRASEGQLVAFTAPESAVVVAERDELKAKIARDEFQLATLTAQKDELEQLLELQKGFQETSAKALDEQFEKMKELRETAAQLEKELEDAKKACAVSASKTEINATLIIPSELRDILLVGIRKAKQLNPSVSAIVISADIGSNN